VDASLAQLLTVLRQPAAVPSEAIPEVLGELERFRTTLLVRMISGAVSERSRDSSSNPLDPQNRLITVGEAAGLLGFRPQYLYELVRRRHFPAVRSGRYVRIRLHDLQKWVQHHRQEAVDGKIRTSLGSPLPMTRPSTDARG
jgi:excisionase family DNA binding protein